MRAILDTSALLGPSIVLGADVEVGISVITLSELHYGVLVAASAAHRAERLRRLTLVEREFDALPVDAEVAQKYGVLAAAVHSVGRKPRARAFDLLIAATAVVHGAQLYTRNPVDLKGLEGLLDVVSL